MCLGSGCPCIHYEEVHLVHGLVVPDLMLKEGVWFTLLWLVLDINLDQGDAAVPHHANEGNSAMVTPGTRLHEALQVVDKAEGSWSLVVLEFKVSERIVLGLLSGQIFFPGDPWMAIFSYNMVFEHSKAKSMILTAE